MTNQLPLFVANETATPSMVLSYGMGADSTVMVTLHCCRRGP
jgi:hypothetical protein